MLRVQIPSLTPTFLQACSFNRQNVGLQNRSFQFKSERACQFPTQSKEQKVFASPLTFFLSRKISLIGKAVVLKTIAHVACGFESCIFRQISIRLRSSTDLERENTNLEVAGSNPAEAAKSFRGRPTGRTLDFGLRNKGSNPFPEANSFYFWAFRRWLYGLAWGARFRWFESSRPDQSYFRLRFTIKKFTTAFLDCAPT